MTYQSELITIITSSEPAIRDRSLDAICRKASLDELLGECHALDRFRRESNNLYEQVRALFFLYAIYRFHIPTKEGMTNQGNIPFEGYTHLLRRRFEEAIDLFLETAGLVDSLTPNRFPRETAGAEIEADTSSAGGKFTGVKLSDGVASALASAYHSLAFQTLADQVRRSVRSAKGNQWMFRIGHPFDHPLRIRNELLAGDDLFPILREVTPVRMDLTHSGWSDIFFLGMDFPEGARVLNVSVDLSVRSSGPVSTDIGDEESSSRGAPIPPIETYLRVIDQPVLRLTSIDLDASAEITTLAEVFDFARDYLGLIKAAVIAAGIVPPGMEGAEQPLSELLERVVGPGYGLELVSKVNDIPKGSRLAVSTNLLASLIAVCMRATGQTKSLTGQLTEDERRVVAARAILGEWIGGSGGGWQDSGGVWPGIKLIQGVESAAGDPEFGISRGRLLPVHTILGHDDVSIETRNALQDSLVLVHGGMAQDVGPILEMVTEKYLLRSEAEWEGRQEAMQIYGQILDILKAGNVQALGQATQHNFEGPIQTIIPWATTQFTEMLIDRASQEFDDDFWGFWMLGGMSGGGMGFIFDPSRKAEAHERLQVIMSEAKRELEQAVPFAMEPVVYDFTINENGTFAELICGDDALMPPAYYTMTVPNLLRYQQRELTAFQRAELNRFGIASRTQPELGGMVQSLFERLLPSSDEDTTAETLPALLKSYGFDRVQHEQIRADLRSGRIGLAQNRLPVRSKIEDVRAGDVFDATVEFEENYRVLGEAAIRNGEVAVVSMAGGAGSRWTHGAGVVKALNPFAKLGGKHRNFIEVHLAKSRKVGSRFGRSIPHIITTSYLTHEPIQTYLAGQNNYGYPGPLILSQGRIVGLRMVPMARDLRFAWEETPQQLLDEQAQKMQESAHAALINWAQSTGEATDYTDNLPSQCLHPVGHWYEVPNMLRNGVLAQLLTEHPQLKTLMVHNIDTLGADLSPALLGRHLESGAAITSEVITRRIEDRGGGLARIDGRLRLIEGLALPHEKVEFGLTYYNSATMWIDIDKLLDTFGLTRSDLTDEAKVATAVRNLAARMPTYITLKDVKKRWGKGQEDIFPIAQFEKLWGDMTLLPELDCQFMAVPRLRGQQLKEVAQLDGWLRDGSAAYLERLCEW